MAWQEKCIKALSDQNLFKDSWHKTRFKELMDCYSNYPFFTRGLCKCMYLSAWDEEHFCIMLENLAEMTLGKEKTQMKCRIGEISLPRSRQIPNTMCTCFLVLS